MDARPLSARLRVHKPLADPEDHIPFLAELVRVTGCLDASDEHVLALTMPVPPRPGGAKGGMAARPWRPGMHLPGSTFGERLPSHIDTGVFMAPADGERLRRTQETLRGVWGVVLDDVGTPKAPRRPELEPTWKIETRPGSEQWGYVFTAPVTDPGEARALAAGLAASGLTDPGAAGVHRLVRLPGSKPPGKERARLVAWSGRTFPPADLPGLLGFELPRFRRGGAMGLPGRPFDPSRVRDPIWSVLLARGWVGSGPNAEGWADVLCPRAHQHSDPENEPWLRYRVGTPSQPPVVRCMHSHGAAYRWNDFFADVRGWRP